jgi:thiaminase
MRAWMCQRACSFSKYMFLINQTGKVSKPTWFLSATVAVYVIWRSIMASHNQLKVWFYNFWVHSCSIKDTTCTRTVTVTLLNWVKCCW